MKRFLAVLFIVILIASSACADDLSNCLTGYNATAKVAGAPVLDKNSAVLNGGHYFFEMDHFSVAFEITPIGIRTGAVYANDEENTADFICSCVAMLWYLGSIDYTATGMLLTQFTNIRAGKTSYPYNIGTDVFQMTSSDLGKYSLIYMNNDLQALN